MRSRRMGDPHGPSGAPIERLSPVGRLAPGRAVATYVRCSAKRWWPVTRPAAGPIENQAQRGIGMAHTKAHGRVTLDAVAHEVCPLDVQMIQQPFSLCRKTGPRHALDAPARRAALTAIKRMITYTFVQELQELGAGVHAKRGPLLQPRVEAARREHQFGLAEPTSS